jgi:signal transduction histidine kinase
VRLALWHTLTLALMLAIFALGAFVFLTRATSQRVDGELRESVQALMQAWGDEQLETGTNVVEAARDALREARLRDRRILLVDGTNSIVGTSDSMPLSPAFAGGPLALLTSPSMQALLRATTSVAPAFSTIGGSDARVRALAVRTTYSGAPYTVVVLRDMTADDELRENFARALLAAIPVALMLAGIGGYLLARASLSPVVAMAAEADFISAGNLNARLSAKNPRDELGQLASVLNRLLARLEAAFAQQRQFMADASHELRTPVTVIRSAADVALDQEGLPAAALRQTLRTVSGQGRRLTRIVDDLFLLARADSGQQPVRRGAVFLEELLADAAFAGRALGATRGVEVTARPADEALVRGDPTLLARLLLNLVDNAVKHAPAGGQVLLALDAVDDGTLPGGPVLPGRWYRMSVCDSGPGVSDDVRDTLFERFVRADPVSSDVPPAAGAGLGLAISRWIASAHGGHVMLESTSAEGAVFSLWLPGEPPVPPASAAENGGDPVARAVNSARYSRHTG